MSEQDRLKALAQYEILDTTPESDFDDLVKLAARVFNVPISTVTIVDAHRQWFKAAIGLSVKETPRDVSVCTHAIASLNPMVIEDLTKDTRFQASPLVTGNPKIGFYAGIPLIGTNLQAIGTFCIMDNKPRAFSAEELELLKTFSNQATRLLDLRLLSNRLRDSVEKVRDINMALSKSEQRWKFALEGAGDGVWDWDIATQAAYFSPTWKGMLGYDDTDIVNEYSAWAALTHPDDLPRVSHALEHYLLNQTESYNIEHRLLCKDQSWKWVLSRGMIVERDTQCNPVRMVGTHADISARKASEELIWQQANFDTLTGLANRRLFFYTLDESIKAALRYHQQFALMYLDLDGFKLVNDVYGHQAGDEVLKETVRRIQKAIRSTDTFARLGGDEFTIILGGNCLKSCASVIADTLLKVFETPYSQIAEDCYISVSMGVAQFPMHGKTTDSLLSKADQAMYQAKAKGKNTWCLAQDD